MAEAAIVFEHEFSESVILNVLKILLPHQYHLETMPYGDLLISQITINGENDIWIDNLVNMVSVSLASLNVKTTTVKLDPAEVAM